MELAPVSKGKFAIKYMEGYSIEFTPNDKEDITELSLIHLTRGKASK